MKVVLRIAPGYQLGTERGMNTYDCYYLEGNNRRSSVFVVATGDADALLRAEELLTESDSFQWKFGKATVSLAVSH